MTTYQTATNSEPTQFQRNLCDESKLTYAQYHGNIPADEDEADYYAPLKVVRLA